MTADFAVALPASRTFQEVRSLQDRVTAKLILDDENRLLQAHEEHYKLVDYVEQKDLESYERLMRKHIERSKQTCLMALEETNLPRG